MSHSPFPCRLRFRPECEADADALKAALVPEFGPDRLTLLNPATDGMDETQRVIHQLGGMVWEIETQSPDEVSSLLAAMSRVPDGHRMLQTVDLADDFTGDAFSDERPRSERITGLISPAHEDVRQTYLEFLGLSEETPGGPG